MENTQNSSRVVIPVDAVASAVALAFKEGVVYETTSEDLALKMPVMFPPKGNTKPHEFESVIRSAKQTFDTYTNPQYNGGGAMCAHNGDLNETMSLRKRSLRGVTLKPGWPVVCVVKTDGGKYASIHATKEVIRWLKDEYAAGAEPKAWDGRPSENGKGTNGETAPKKQRSPKSNVSENPKDLVNRLTSIAPNGAVTRGLLSAIEKHETSVLGIDKDWSEIGIPQAGIWSVLKEVDRQEKKGRPGVYEVSYTFEVPESLQKEFDLRSELQKVSGELATKKLELADLNSKKFGDAEKAISDEFDAKFKKAQEAYEQQFKAIEAKKAEKLAELSKKKLADSEYQAAAHIVDSINAKVVKAEQELAELLKPAEIPAQVAENTESK